MFKVIHLTTLFFITLLFFVTAGEVFAEASAELERAKSDIISLIQGSNYTEAEAQTQQLIADFSDRKDIAKTVWEIAKKYEELKRYDKTFELYQYNVEHFPNDMYAMWSQVEIIYSHLRNGDHTAADAAADNLLSVFSEQATLPKEIWQVVAFGILPVLFQEVHKLLRDCNIPLANASTRRLRNPSGLSADRVT